MPYKSNDELPPAVRNNLPEHAQDIFRETFNSAWERYADPKSRRKGGSREQVSIMVAWSAVKKRYTKGPGGRWIEKEAA